MDTREMQQLITQICAAIEPQNFRVKNFPELVFLCGGYIDKGGAKKSSIRHVYYEHLEKTQHPLFSKLILAEDVNQWLEGSPYEDLLELEDDLANLVSVVPIFLESAGAAAELGYFIADSEVCKKLYLLMESRYNDNPSFIFLGPVKKLKNKIGEDRCYVFPWLDSKNELREDVKDDDLNEITQEIVSIITKQDKSQSFDSKRAAHRVLLLCDFVDVAFVVRLAEIRCFFEGLGIELEEKELKKYLLIAEKLKMIAKETLGASSSTFYFNPNYGEESSEYIIKYPARSPRIRWKGRFRDYIQRNKAESKRMRARKTWLENRGRL